MMSHRVATLASVHMTSGPRADLHAHPPSPFVQRERHPPLCLGWAVLAAPDQTFMYGLALGPQG